MNERVVVVLPTYNERENLPGMLSRLRDSVPSASILVVDDNSPDGTGEIADGIAAADPQIKVLHRAGKEGLGAAYLAGFAWALQHDFEVIVESDADGSHRPEELPRLLEAIVQNDLVIGSRWVEGGSVIDWPLHRRVLSRAGSWYAARMLRLGQRDATSGYRAFRAGALREVDIASVKSQGYCFQIEALWRANRAELRVAEVPITFEERRLGASKMSGGIVIEAMLRVTLWGFGMRLHADRRQVEQRA